MKILIVIKSLKVGGAEKQAIIDAFELKNRGHDITLAYNTKGEFNSLIENKIPLYKLKYRNVFLSSIQLLFYLIPRKFDIIHAHMFWAEKIVSIPGKLTGSKIVFNEHGLGLWRKWYHILIMRSISLFADKIVNTCEEISLIRANKEKINKKKLITIYTSNNISNHNITQNEISKTYKNKFIIGYIGRFSKIKRLEIFIKLAELLKSRIENFKIILIGKGEEKELIEKYISEKKLNIFFETPGFVENLSNYYKIFDVFVLPSKREGLSLSLIESNSNSIPAIAFNVGGNSEIIQDNITGFVISNGDIQLMADKILYLYDNPKMRKQMGEKAKKFINQNFSVNVRINKLEKLYKDIKL